MSTTTNRLTEAAIKNLNRLADKLELEPRNGSTTAKNFEREFQAFGMIYDISPDDARFLFGKSLKYPEMAAHIRAFISDRTRTTGERKI